MSKRLSRRIEKIEKALKPEKGEWLKWPCPDGSFIEVPGCRSLVDVAALAGIGRNDATVDETERN
jgi:hypothetical protein